MGTSNSYRQEFLQKVKEFQTMASSSPKELLSDDHHFIQALKALDDIEKILAKTPEGQKILKQSHIAQEAQILKKFPAAQASAKKLLQLIHDAYYDHEKILINLRHEREFVEALKASLFPISGYAFHSNMTESEEEELLKNTQSTHEVLEHIKEEIAQKFHPQLTEKEANALTKEYLHHSLYNDTLFRYQELINVYRASLQYENINAGLMQELEKSLYAIYQENPTWENFITHSIQKIKLEKALYQEYYKVQNAESKFRAQATELHQSYHHLCEDFDRLLKEFA